VQFQGGYQSNGCSGSPSYDWDFGDDSSHSSEQSPSHTYAVGGGYTWSMTVALGGASCSRSGVVVITSSEPPIGSPGTYAYLVAASAHTAGLNGTNWVTDLTLANPGLADTRARLYFIKRWPNCSGPDCVPPDLPVAYPIQVPLRQSVALGDVVQTVFGDTSAAGAILVGSDVPLLVGSRTYNDTLNGSFGQYVPGRPVGEAIAFGQTAWLIGLSESTSTTAGFRTSIGLVNVTAQRLDIEVALYRADGTWLGTQNVSLNPYEFQQLDRIYTQVTSSDVANGYAVVDTTTQGGRLFAYAAVIDNRSGDAINVPAR
jgi:hypothetical protein